MIRGRVSSDREPVIRVELRGPNRRRRRLTAIVDTGYNGALTLPAQMVLELDLKFRGFRQSILADDSEITSPVYTVRVRWDGRWRSVLAECSGSTPLVGMELLDGYRLLVEGNIDGAVTIEEMP